MANKYVAIFVGVVTVAAASFPFLKGENITLEDRVAQSQQIAKNEKEIDTTPVHLPKIHLPNFASIADTKTKIDKIINISFI